LKPILILCLGNDVLTDDAFGFRVGEALNRPEVSECADVWTAAVAGFALLDILEGRQAVLIVDTVVTGKETAGTVHFFPKGHWTPSRSLVSSHQISLPNALQFGRLLGYNMPEDIDILAVEASDVCTLSEEMTPLVAAAVPRAAAIVEDWIRDKVCEVEHGYRNPKEAIA
jgi:hydrogenase maturation protease